VRAPGPRARGGPRGYDPATLRLAPPAPPSATAPPAAVRYPLLAAYLLAGLGSVVTDFSLFTLLTRTTALSPVGAHVISRPLGAVTCFVLNRRFTFRSAGPLAPEFVRFWCVFGVSLALTSGLIAVFCGPLGLAPVPGKALAEALAVVFNFLALKHWTFRRSPAT